MPQIEKLAEILVVDDQRFARSLLAAMLEEEGYRVLTAGTGKEAIELAREEEPDLVLLDPTMPDIDGLAICRALKSEPRTRDIGVILLSGAGDADLESGCFHLGAIDSIHKPFLQEELLARVKAQVRLRSQLEALRRRYREVSDKLERDLAAGEGLIDQRAVETEVKNLVFESDVSRVPAIVNQLLTGIGSRLQRSQRNDLALGLHEMILNAIEHGNLGIGSAEKCAALEANRFEELVKRKQLEAARAGKKVHIEYRFDGKKAVYTIRDEGQGFDWRLFLERAQPENLLALNGRGLLISRYLFDSIRYNDAGNEVTLEKVIS